jgi:NH3-dependent NAD+ synthetase
MIGMSFASKIMENVLKIYIYTSRMICSILKRAPTAELEPITSTYCQTDEVDMNMTYEELSFFGRLRTLSKSGPYSMFLKLSQLWHQHMSITQVIYSVQSPHVYTTIITSCIDYF